MGVEVKEYASKFFSSRRRHTILQGDWNSDVCSSDLSSLMMNVTPRQSRGQRRNRMATFTIHEDNNSTTFVGAKEAAQAGVSSERQNGLANCGQRSDECDTAAEPWAKENPNGHVYNPRRQPHHRICRRTRSGADQGCNRHEFRLPGSACQGVRRMAAEPFRRDLEQRPWQQRGEEILGSQEGGSTAARREPMLRRIWPACRRRRSTSW